MTRQNFFLLITSHHDVSEKKILQKQKNLSEIFNQRLPCQARRGKKTNSSWKIIEVTHSRRSGRGHGTGVLIFWQKYFFSKFLIWPTGLPWRRSSLKIAARWRYRLPSNNLTAHYNSQFFVSFQMPLNVSELGLNIIQFISNIYVGVFL